MAEQVFVYGTYLLALLMLLVSMLHYREYRPPNLPYFIATEVILLIALFLGFWLVESYAHAATPFLNYGPLTADPLRLDFIHLPTVGADGPLPPPIQMCVDIPKENLGIPVSVLLMETILTYSAFHITRMAGVPVLFRPFFAAVALVFLDLLLDPVFSKSHDCSNSLIYHGLELWRWWDSAHPAMQSWFGVVLFNFAAWFGAPLIAVAFTLWISVYVAPPLSATTPPPFPGWLLVLLIVFVIVWIPLLSPRQNFTPELQWTVLLVPIAIGLILSVIGIMRRDEVEGHYNAAWLLGIFFYAVLAFALLLVYFSVAPMTPAIAALLFALAVIFIVLPYVLPPP